MRTGRLAAAALVIATLAIAARALLAIAAWQRDDGHVFLGDENLYLARALAFEEAIADSRWGDVLRDGDPHPPLVPALGALWLLAFGHRGDALASVRELGLAWFAASLAAVGLLAGRAASPPAAPDDRRGESRGASRTAAMLAMLAWASMPVALAQAALFTTDLPLAALVSWAALALLHPRALESRGRRAAAGVLCGAAMLVKWTALVFLAPVALIVLLRRDGRPAGRRLRGLATVAAVAAVVALPWYLANLDAMRSYASPMSGGGLHAIWVRPAGPAWAWRELVVPQAGAVLVIGGAAGLAVAAFRSAVARAALAQAVAAAAVFAVLPYKEPHYLLPALAFVAAGVALLALRLPPPVRTPALALVAAFLVLQSACILPWSSPSAASAPGAGASPPSGFDLGPVLPRPWRPDPGDGGTREIVRLLAPFASGSRPVVFVAPDGEKLSAAAVLTAARRSGVALSVPPNVLDLAGFGEVSRPGAGLDALRDADFAITTGGPSGRVGSALARRPTLVSELFNEALRAPSGPLRALVTVEAVLRSDEGHRVEILRLPRPWPPAARRALADFLRRHWPDDPRAAPDREGEAADPGAAAGSERDREAAADGEPATWSAVARELAAGREAEARRIVEARAAACPDDLQAADFLRREHGIEALLRDVPERARAFVAAGVSPGGASLLLEAGFRALDEGDVPLAARALRRAAAWSPEAADRIRADLTKRAPSTTLRRRFSEAADVYDVLALIERDGVERLLESGSR